MDSKELAVSSTHTLRPHPPTLVKVCCVCSKPQARWSLLHSRFGPEPVDLCSLCFLYSSGWLTPVRARRVDTVVSALGLRARKVLERVEGRLVLVSDADNVLGAITLQDRVERLNPAVIAQGAR